VVESLDGNGDSIEGLSQKANEAGLSMTNVFLTLHKVVTRTVNYTHKMSPVCRMLKLGTHGTHAERAAPNHERFPEDAASGRGGSAGLAGGLRAGGGFEDSSDKLF